MHHPRCGGHAGADRHAPNRKPAPDDPVAARRNTPRRATLGARHSLSRPARSVRDRAARPPPPKQDAARRHTPLSVRGHGSVHRLLPLRAHLRRGAGAVRVACVEPGRPHRDPTRPGGHAPGEHLRELWGVRGHVPDGGDHGPRGRAARRTRHLDPHDMPVLRHRVRDGCGGSEPADRPDSPAPRCAGQQGALVRQGSLRAPVRACVGPRAVAHDPHGDGLEGRGLGRGVRHDRGEAGRDSQGERARFCGGLGVVAGHQRGELPRPEVRARGAGLEQRGLLCARVPRADRCRHERHAGDRGGHQLLRRHRAGERLPD